jgi:uncharacterized protein YukE
MSDILVHPNQLQSTASNLRTSASSIMNSFQRVDLNLNNLSAQIFEGISANVLQARYQTKRESLLNLYNQVLYFADQLEKIATVFENADRELQNNVKSNSSGSIPNNLNWLPFVEAIFPLGILPFLSIISNLFPKGINLLNPVHGNQPVLGSSPTTTVNTQEPSSDQTPSQPSQSDNNAISQLNPSGLGDPDILKLKINYSLNGKQLETTVLGDIETGGCLMTGYTMLLRDRGLNESVTDLYKANWEVSNPNTWQNATKEGVLDDLNTYVQGGMVSKASNGVYKNVPVTLSGTNDLEKYFSLNTQIEDHGPVILEVTGKGITQHWIVVDHPVANKNGYYQVRDPLSTSSSDETIKIGEGDGTYQFHSGKNTIEYVDYVKKS